MTQANRELIVRGVATLRRSTIWWSLGIAVLTITTTAFWPSLEGSEAIESFDDMGSVLEAFGAQNMGTPAGYLDGQMFAIFVIILAAAEAAVALAIVLNVFYLFDSIEPGGVDRLRD